ncbi:MAG: carboxypeptidase-like regulatory domain-containing protein [Lautropia sp.]
MSRGWILNRFVLTFGGIAVVALCWNLYVIANDDGRLSGRVTTADGRPVEGAVVVLSKKSVVAVERVGSTRTDADGRFVFENHGQYSVVLSARKSGVGTMRRRTIALWFRNQNREIAEPLVLVR